MISKRKFYELLNDFYLNSQRFLFNSIYNNKNKLSFKLNQKIIFFQ